MEGAGHFVMESYNLNLSKNIVSSRFVTSCRELLQGPLLYGRPWGERALEQQPSSSTMRYTTTAQGGSMLICQG